MNIKNLNYLRIGPFSNLILLEISLSTASKLTIEFLYKRILNADVNESPFLKTLKKLDKLKLLIFVGKKRFWENK